MSWTAFATYLVQSIAVVIVLGVVLFFGSAVVAGVLEAIRRDK